jgi:uncharacterized protein (TIGR02611 family)
VGGQVGTKPNKPAEQPTATAEQGDDDAVPGDESPLRHPFRRFFQRHRTLDTTYRVVVGIIGAAIVLGGIALIPLPGPGWLIVFAGLALLATEFAWADRLLDFARDKVRGWTHWVGRQSILVRALIGLGGLLLVAGAIALYVSWQGVPDWLPLV